MLQCLWKEEKLAVAWAKTFWYIFNLHRYGTSTLGFCHCFTNLNNQSLLGSLSRCKSKPGQRYFSQIEKDPIYLRLSQFYQRSSHRSKAKSWKDSTYVFEDPSEITQPFFIRVHSKTDAHPENHFTGHLASIYNLRIFLHSSANTSLLCTGTRPASSAPSGPAWHARILRGKCGWRGTSSSW